MIKTVGLVGRGDDQFVLLPVDLHLQSDRVRVRRHGRGVLIEPVFRMSGSGSRNSTASGQSRFPMFGQTKGADGDELLRGNLNVGRRAARLGMANALGLEAVEMKRNCVLHLSLDFLPRATGRDATRKVRRVGGVAGSGAFDDDQVLHGFGPACSSDADAANGAPPRSPRHGIRAYNTPIWRTRESPLTLVRWAAFRACAGFGFRSRLSSPSSPRVRRPRASWRSIRTSKPTTFERHFCSRPKPSGSASCLLRHLIRSRATLLDRRADVFGAAAVSFFEQPSNVALAMQHTNDFKRLRVGTVDHQVPEHRPESDVLGSEVGPKMADPWVIGEELHRVVKCVDDFQNATRIVASRYSRIFSRSPLAACVRTKSLTMPIGSSV